MVVGSSRVLLLVVGSVTAATLLFQVAMMNMIMEAFMSVAAAVPAEPLPEPPALATSEFVATLLDGDKIGGRAHVYEPQFKTASLPVVLMHGMGDAAGHTGMLRIRDLIAKQVGAYAVNIQIGDSVSDDVRNSFLMTMDAQLDEFALKVREVWRPIFAWDDPHLANGFNAAGFSQGNLLIRAYIERYNDPPVSTFISFHGPLAGVGALPQCAPTAFICKEINRLIGNAVYTEEVQEHVAQSNYFRDPERIDDYLKYAKFLPDINNEKTPVNETYRSNFIKLKNLVLVRANADTQVIPKESEFFGCFENGSYDRVLGFNETSWYKEDSFGLQTLHKADKVHFLETEGNHLQFTQAFLLNTVNRYFAHPALLLEADEVLV